MKAEKTPGSKNGYAIVGKNCGRDKNGIFRCVCGKCKSNTSKR